MEKITQASDTESAVLVSEARSRSEELMDSQPRIPRITAGYASMGKGRQKIKKRLSFFLIPDQGDNDRRYDFWFTWIVSRVGKSSRSFVSIMVSLCLVCSLSRGDGCAEAAASPETGIFLP